MRNKLEKIRCAKCGKIVDLERTMSGFVSDCELDGKPVNSGMIPRIETCPYCGYQNLDLSRRVSEDPFDKAYFKLVCSWQAESSGNSEETDSFRRETVMLLEKGFSYKLDADKILLYIELLRRLGDFKKAKDVVETYKETFYEHHDSDETMFRVIKYEEKLIKEENAEKHLMSNIF